MDNKLLLVSCLDDIPDGFMALLDDRKNNWEPSPLMREFEYKCGDYPNPPTKEEMSAYWTLVMAYFETIHLAGIIPFIYFEESLKIKGVFPEPEYFKKYSIYHDYIIVATNDELRKSINILIERVKNDKA